MSIYSDCFRIAEAAHAGCDDMYIRDLCREVADKHESEGVTEDYIYRHSERIFDREFARRERRAGW